MLVGLRRRLARIVPSMPEVAIIGAGPLGGDIAFVLARCDVARSILIVDESRQIAAGKALDIMQSAPIEGFSTLVAGSTDPYSAVGAPILVVADTQAGEWQGDAALALVRRVARTGATIVCAGQSHQSVVERSVRELGLDWRRVVGSAPGALLAGVRAMTALEANRSPHEVSVAVLGVPPRHVVIAWDDATIGGYAATRALEEPSRRRIAARSIHLWPPGPFALAEAAVACLRSLLGSSRETMVAFVTPDDALGVKARAAAVPVQLGPSGVERIVMPALSVHDRVAFENAVML